MGNCNIQGPKFYENCCILTHTYCKANSSTITAQGNGLLLQEIMKTRIRNAQTKMKRDWENEKAQLREEVSMMVVSPPKHNSNFSLTTDFR